MGSARKTILEILERQPNKQMDLVELSKEMDKRNVLGFGVSIWDPVYALKQQGKVIYDPVREIVYLV